MPLPRWAMPVIALNSLVATIAPSGAQTVIDLTHPIPTFQRSSENPARPDTSKPWTDLGAYPIYGEQAVLWLRQVPASGAWR